MRRFVVFALFVAGVVVGVVVGSGAGMVPAQATAAPAISSPSTHIAAGASHTCALISDGTVTCWGYNRVGQLGDGSNTDSYVPVTVTGGVLAGKTVTDIAAGAFHTCALISDGTVTCWGYNGDGQIGDDSTTNRNLPVAVTSGALTNKTVTDITAGGEHTCALISDGTVTCWGYNSSGQLGTGDTTYSDLPVAVTDGALENKTVTDITAGGEHTCALISDGTVTCWGNNYYGRLGDGSTTNRNLPVAVTGGALTNKTVTDITAGGYHTCALISDGTVTCWGNNSAGQLGDESTTNSNLPVAVTGGALAGKTVTDITAGANHTCALISDGTVTCWGNNYSGQLGDESNTNSNLPVAVTGGALAGKTVTDITAGYTHTCALISDGTVTCWGNNYYGQLGDESNTNRNLPVAVSGGALANKTVTDITAGAYHTCALISDGTVTCWGNNYSGQLGDGSNTDSNLPVAVTGGALAGKTVTDITAGYTHTCALISDGTVTCWGNNYYGQLGDESTTNSNLPVAVTGGALENKTVTDITAGDHHTCALISDGTVTCWGNNEHGQLGDESTTNRNLPVAVTGGALANKTVTDITAGANHTCALISDGTVTCWGNNGFGQLGDESTTNSNLPVAVTGGVLANKTVTDITAGYTHTCALISDGTVTCWGNNGYGQLGDESTTNSNLPVAVTGGALAGKTVTDITAGNYHTCALISDGTVTCWGRNIYGQLGAVSNTYSNLPVAVTGGALTNKTVTDITAGYGHTCALISDGTVTCWGNNSAGQLGDGGNTDRNLPVAVVWLRNIDVPTMSGTAEVGAILTADEGTWAGYTPTFAYQWYACTQQVSSATQTVPGTCETINAATQTTLTLTSTHQGKYITVEVTGTSVGTDSVSWLSVSTSTKVLMRAAATTKPTLTGTAEVGATLTANQGTWAGYPAPTFAYQWYACTQQVSSATQTVPETCETINAATQTTLTLTSTHQGKYITVEVTATSAGTDPVSWLSVSTSTEVLMRASATLKPTLTGTVKVGEILTANEGTWTGLPAPTIAYQWYACTQQVSSATQTVPVTCAPINAATQTTLTLTSTHQGQYIAVEVTGTSAGTDPVSWLSVSTSTKVLMRATATTKPTLTGTAKVEAKLTANKGTWTGSPAPTFTYQWYVCTQKVSSATQTVPETCVAINAATQTTLTLTSTHQGKYIAVKVTGTSAGTDPVSWLSVSTSTKVLMRAAATTKPTVTGTVKVGKTLTANTGTWTGSPAPTFTYQWYACTQKVSSATQTVPGTCATINAATQTTLTLTSTHQGKYITVKVTGTSSGTPKTLWLAKTTTKVS